MAGSNKKPSKELLPKKKMISRFGKPRPGNDSGSKNSPQRSRINTVVYAAAEGGGLIVATGCGQGDQRPTSLHWRSCKGS